MPFTGELMTCVVCGLQQGSNPRVESGWRRLDVDHNCFYICPDEFPPDNAPKTEFKKAYDIAIACCLNEVALGSGGKSVVAVEEYRRKRSEYVRSKIHRNSKGFG